MGRFRETLLHYAFLFIGASHPLIPQIQSLSEKAAAAENAAGAKPGILVYEDRPAAEVRFNEVRPSIHLYNTSFLHNRRIPSGGSEYYVELETGTR